MNDSELYEWHRAKFDRLFGNNGSKPFSQKDAIINQGSRNLELFEFEGKYYVDNWEHIVAAAHNLAIKRIRAIVRHCDFERQN
jgi:hypothetical protein